MRKTKVVILGAGFIADIHLESYHRFVPDAAVVGVYTRNGACGKANLRKRLRAGAITLAELARHLNRALERHEDLESLGSD